MPAITKTRNLGTLQGGNPYINPASLPNLGAMTKSATGIIQSELGGMPNPAETRTANAAWGVANGLAPAQGMDFLNQRGSRLYRSEIENRKRTGLQDLLSFLKGYSGTVSATPGQLMQYGQRQQENSFENAMALMQRQFAQRGLDEENAREIPYSYLTSGAGVGGGSGLYQGYNFSRNKRGGIIQR